MDDLRHALDTVRSRIAKAKGRRLSEQSTKATLIEPVLRALGWDVEDIEQVQHEYKGRPQHRPVDYALLQQRTVRLFVEAKALGEDLGDARWASQIMGYAGVAGVGWIALTDGDEWRLYNAHAEVPVEQKLFWSVRVSEAGTAAEMLRLLARTAMGEPDLERLWRRHFIDSRVRGALEDLFDGGGDASLVKFVRKRVQGVSAAEIRASLAQVQVSFDFPPPGDPPPPPPPGRVTVLDLVQVELLKPQQELFSAYKGRDLRARIEPDGRLRFGDRTVDSPSMAASLAIASVRGKVRGKYPAAAGWTFWKTTGPDGKQRSLDDVRREYLAKQGRAE